MSMSNEDPYRDPEAKTKNRAAAENEALNKRGAGQQKEYIHPISLVIWPQ